MFVVNCHMTLGVYFLVAQRGEVGWIKVLKENAFNLCGHEVGTRFSRNISLKCLMLIYNLAIIHVCSVWP